MSKNIRLIVNARFLTQRLTGVQRFSIEISKEIKKIYGDEVVFVAPNNLVMDEVAKELEVIKFGNLSGHLWEQFEILIFLKKYKNAKFLNLGNLAPVLYNNNYTVVHDVSFIRFKESYSFLFRWFYKLIIPIIARKSKVLMTVSQFSSDEISYEYNIRKPHVVYNSFIESPSVDLEDNVVNDSYILTVSSTTKQKNIDFLVSAYSKLSAPKKKLVIVGGSSSVFKESSIKGSENILCLGHVTDAELANLYKNASFFVFPSLYEGFGIPPLEAQSFGCPCIVSNAASLPEVLKDSVVYFDPNDESSLIEVLEKLDEIDVDILISKGFSNIKRFSWSRSAERVYDIVENN